MFINKDQIKLVMAYAAIQYNMNSTKCDRNIKVLVIKKKKNYLIIHRVHTEDNTYSVCSGIRLFQRVDICFQVFKQHINDNDCRKLK